MITSTNGGSANGAGKSGGKGVALATLKAGRRDSSITWEDAQAERWMITVSRIVAAGGLVSMSATSDGGAVMAYVRLNGEAEKFYAGSHLELEEMVDSLTTWSLTL